MDVLVEENIINNNGFMVELVDTSGLSPDGHCACSGSSPDEATE